MLRSIYFNSLYLYSMDSQQMPGKGTLHKKVISIQILKNVQFKESKQIASGHWLELVSRSCRLQPQKSLILSEFGVLLYRLSVMLESESLIKALGTLKLLELLEKAYNKKAENPKFAVTESFSRIKIQIYPHINRERVNQSQNLFFFSHLCPQIKHNHNFSLFVCSKLLRSYRHSVAGLAQGAVQCIDRVGGELVTLFNVFMPLQLKIHIFKSFSHIFPIGAIKFVGASVYT